MALRNTFKEIDGRFRFATFMDHKVIDEVIDERDRYLDGFLDFNFFHEE